MADKQLLVLEKFLVKKMSNCLFFFLVVGILVLGRIVFLRERRESATYDEDNSISRVSGLRAGTTIQLILRTWSEKHMCTLMGRDKYLWSE